MEQEEEHGYDTNYSPSPPQQAQYSYPQQRGFHSDEYESLEMDSSPPPPHLSNKDVRYAKSNRESSKKHHHSDQKRDRNEEPLQHSAKMSSNRGMEGKKNSLENPAQKTSKQNKKSTTHQRKVEEKKKKEEGECIV